MMPEIPEQLKVKRNQQASVERYYHLNEAICQYLRTLNISVDDVTYYVFIPETADNSRFMNPAFCLNDLLDGPCDNRWYFVQMPDGRRGLLGIAYHA